MQTTFELNTKEIGLDFIEIIKGTFKNKNVKITIEEMKQTDESNILKKFKAAKPIIIDPSIDIRALIDEASDPKISFE